LYVKATSDRQGRTLPVATTREDTTIATIITDRPAATKRVVFGPWARMSVLSAIAVLLIAAWEFSLGLYLVVKGFKPSPITVGMAA
jgi:hypothetical protein